MTAIAGKRSFKCLQCGACCRWSGHVLLTDGDISRLAAALNISEHCFIEQYTILARNRRGLSLKDQADGSCILLAGDRCSMYEARPDQCRDFPHGWRIAEGCPVLDRMNRNQSVPA